MVSGVGTEAYQISLIWILQLSEISLADEILDLKKSTGLLNPISV